MKPEKICLFDMDGTLCDYDKAMNADMAKLAAPGEPQYDWRKPCPPHIVQRMDLIKRQPGWWRNLEVVVPVLQVLQIAREIGFKIHVLTKGPKRCTSAWTEKVEWCNEHLGDIEVTVTQDKGLVYGTALVDDYPEYMKRWLQWRPRGLGIMPINSQNIKFRHPNVIKFNRNYGDIWKALEQAYARKHG